MKKINKNDVEDIMSLTLMQKGMLVYYLKEPKSDLYFEQLQLNIQNEIDIEIFKKAWNTVTSLNEMLRTVFRWECLEEPVQIILKQHEANIRIINLVNEKEELIPELICGILEMDKAEKFDLSEVPFRITLCRTDSSTNVVIISNHHILYDGWSSGILLKEFFNIYDELYNKKTPLLIKKNKYKEYIKFINKQDKNKQKEFWSKYLENIKLQQVSTDSNISEDKKFDIENYILTMDKQLISKVVEFVTTNNTTLAAFFYCVWSITLHIHYNSQDILIGTVVSGRDPNITGIENMVGLFINTIPLRVKLNTESRILDVLSDVQSMLLERKEYENTSLVNVKRYCNIKGKDNILNNIVVLENYPIDKMAISESGLLKIKSYSMFIRAEFDLILNISVVSDLEITICYNKKLYSEKDIIALGDCFKRIMAAVITTLRDSKLRIRDIELIDSEEKNKIYSIFKEDSNEINIDFDFDIFNKIN